MVSNPRLPFTSCFRQQNVLCQYRWNTRKSNKRKEFYAESAIMHLICHCHVFKAEAWNVKSFQPHLRLCVFVKRQCLLLVAVQALLISLHFARPKRKERQLLLVARQPQQEFKQLALLPGAGKCWREGWDLMLLENSAPTECFSQVLLTRLMGAVVQFTWRLPGWAKAL